MAETPDPTQQTGDGNADFLRRLLCYLESRLGANELAELEAELLADPEKRKLFVRYSLTRAALIEEFSKGAPSSATQKWQSDDSTAQGQPISSIGPSTSQVAELVNSAPLPPRSVATPSQKRPESIFTGSRLSAWRIAAIFIFIASAVFTLTSPTWTGWWRSTPVATLADAVDAQWDAPQTRLDVGDHLPYGSLFLKSGYASIRLDNGVKLVVVGPAHFSVDSLKLAHLDEGKLTVDVPHAVAAAGYSVKIPSGMVTDLGTTFGVTAFANGESSVQVLKGSVQAKLLADDGRQKDQVVLTENHAEALSPITGSLARIPVEPDAYVTNIRSIPITLALHNSGQDLKPGDADPYWRIIANSDDPSWTPKPAIVAKPLYANGANVWAVPSDSAASQWLSTTQDTPDMTVHCRLTFATTLDLTGIDPDSVRLHLAILADNEILEVRLNGQVTPIALIEHDNHFYQKTFNNMFDLDHGFVAGKNTLEFDLGNKPYGPPILPADKPNPMGLRVELSGTAIRQETH